MRVSINLSRGIAALLTVTALNSPAQAATNEILVGLDADLTAGSAKAGEAIRRGIKVAMQEINGTGGALGRKFRLIVRDHRGNPVRGVANIEAFARQENLVAVMGGLHTPVAMHELDAIHRHRLIYLDPWAAGTAVIENGRTPNYAFRVSVRDEFAGDFLIGKALDRGYRRPGLLLEKTAWGRSNLRAMSDALSKHDLTPAGVQWFLWGTKDMTRAILALRASGADVIMLVANAPEGISLVRSMAALPLKDRLPIVSHWGITGGEFVSQAGAALRKVDLVFLQTFSFLDPPFAARAAKMVKAYTAMFPGAHGAGDIFSPVGTAHAYDLIHLLARAIQQAGTLDRSRVRDALETIKFHPGLVRDYDPPFSPANHDALTARDFRMARYHENGQIVPANDERRIQLPD